MGGLVVEEMLPRDARLLEREYLGWSVPSAYRLDIKRADYQVLTTVEA